jgi:PKD repeat protein
MNSKLTCLLIIVVVSAGFFGASSSVPSCFGATPSSLTVNVQTDPTTPLANATVSIYGPVGNQPQNYTAQSGVDGNAFFGNLTAGTYQILASAPGYQSIVSFSLVVSGETSGYATFSYAKAKFTYTPSNIVINKVVSFDASPSNSSGVILGYSWDFGDNANGSGINPAHIYRREGNFTVKLTVSTTVGNAVSSQIVQVTDDSIPPWILLIIPFLFPIPLFLWYRRRRYYVVIQARIPPGPRNLHCPGDGTNCEDCKLTPC